MPRDYDDDRVIIERTSGSGVPIGSFLAGLAIGVGVALLFAPQSGDETRDAIRRTARQTRRRAGEMLDESRSRGRELVGDARTRVSEGIDESRRRVREKRNEFSRAVDAGRQAMRDSRREMEQRLDEPQRAPNEGTLAGTDTPTE